MAKGASTEARMGKLHGKLTELFIKVLKQYESNMDQLDEGAVLDELMAEGLMPNPAMLGAVSKFLKDNAISIDSEEVDELSSMERRLAAKKAKRPSLVSITDLPVADHG